MTEQKKAVQTMMKRLKQYERAVNRLYESRDHTAAIVADIEVSALLFNEALTRLRIADTTSQYPEFIAL